MEMTFKDLLGTFGFGEVIEGVLEVLRKSGLEGNKLTFITSAGVVQGEVGPLPEEWAEAFECAEATLAKVVKEGESAPDFRLKLGHLYLKDVTITAPQGNTVNLPFMLLDPAHIIGITFGKLTVTGSRLA